MQSEFTYNYKKYNRTKILIIVSLFILLVGFSIISLSIGSYKLSFGEIIKGIFGLSNNRANAIILDIRHPRIIASLVVGLALSVSGCIMQSVLRNPLASSSTLGVSQGSVFGTSIAILIMGVGEAGINETWMGSSLIAIFAFLGGMTSVTVVLFLNKFKKLDSSSIVLVGVALSSLFAGARILIQYFANEIAVASIIYWTFGDLGRIKYGESLIIAILSVLAYIFFILNARKYNTLDSGTDTAKSLGVNVDFLILASMFLATLLAATAVAFVGLIAFIGLIAPHIARLLVGVDHKYLLPASALCGAVVLLISDMMARAVIPPIILPIGGVTSFLGAPLFMYLIFRGKK